MSKNATRRTYSLNSPMNVIDPSGAVAIPMLKCFRLLLKLKKLIAQGNAEMDCDLLAFLEKYSGGFPSDAMMHYIKEKSPTLIKDATSACGKTVVSTFLKITGAG